MKQDHTILPALAVMLSLGAFVAVLAFAMWPKGTELNPTSVDVRHRTVKNANVSNVNAVKNTNAVKTNSAVNTNSTTTGTFRTK